VGPAVTCAQCCHFHKFGADEAGTCRRYPPAKVQDPRVTYAEFPVVSEKWACGDFAMRQEPAVVYVNPADYRGWKVCVEIPEMIRALNDAGYDVRPR
jgi:hypothetical protein